MGPGKRKESDLTDKHRSMECIPSFPGVPMMGILKNCGLPWLERSRCSHACRDGSQVLLPRLQPVCVPNRLPADTLGRERQLSRFFFQHQGEVLSAGL